MSTFVSHSRPCHSPTWQECCPGTPMFSHVVILYDFVLHLLVALHLSFIRDIFFFYSFYNTKSVVLCLGITAAVCLLVTIFSFQTKVRKKKILFWLDFHAVPHHSNVWCHLFVQFDVTSYQGVLFVFCMVLFISGIVLAFILPFQYVSITMHISCLPFF